MINAMLEIKRENRNKEITGITFHISPQNLCCNLIIRTKMRLMSGHNIYFYGKIIWSSVSGYRSNNHFIPYFSTKTRHQKRYNLLALYLPSY